MIIKKLENVHPNVHRLKIVFLRRPDNLSFETVPAGSTKTKIKLTQALLFSWFKIILHKIANELVVCIKGDWLGSLYTPP